MTSPDGPQSEINCLLAHLSRGELSEEQVKRLERLVISEPEVRRRYVRYQQLCASLEWELSGNLRGSVSSSDSLGSLSSTPPAPILPPVLPVVFPEITASLSHLKPPSVLENFVALGVVSTCARMPVMSSFFLATAVMVCFITTLGLLHLSSDDRNRTLLDYQVEDSLAEQGPIGPAWQDLPLETEASKPVLVAKITSGQGQRWADAGLAMPPSLDLQEGQVLDLEGGLVEVVFLNGTRVILEGPVRFTAQSFDRGYLHRGKLVAQVVDSPDGFVVQTPKVTIVDLGTEFGVDVLPSETTEVQVFQGAVEATPNRPGGKRVRLTAGLGAQFYAQGAPLIEGTSGRTSRFVRPAEFAARLARPKTIGRASQPEPFVIFDVNFAGGIAGAHPRVASPVAGGVSTVPSAQKGAILRDGYTDSRTSETIGGKGKLVAELSEPGAFVRCTSSKADKLRGTGVVTLEFDLLQDSACNRNTFVRFTDEEHRTIGALMLQPLGRWCLLQYTSPYALDTTVEVGGSIDPDTQPGTPVHCIYQLDLDTNLQRVSLDRGATFSSASIPENSNFSQFGVRNASNWDQGSIVVGGAHIESTFVRQETREVIQ